VSKTERDKQPKVRKTVHPKKYTDPIEDIDAYIEEELEYGNLSRTKESAVSKP
jgi:hypothetical protein